MKIRIETAMILLAAAAMLAVGCKKKSDEEPVAAATPAPGVATRTTQAPKATGTPKTTPAVKPKSTPSPTAARTAAPEPLAKGKIGLSVLTMNNPFFKVIADTMTAEAAKHSYEVLAVSGDFQVQKQQNQVQDFIVKDVSAIVLCPCDSVGIGPVIKEANDAGIPVFTCDIASMAAEGRVVSHIATDNYGGGRLAARAMIEALEGKGKIAILDHPEVESVILRTRGFHDELREANTHPEVELEIVAVLPGGAASETSYRAAQDLLQAHPDLDGIFCINDPTAFGAIAALEEAGKLADVTIIGFDGQPEGKQMIKQGKIYADPIQFPDRIATRTVETIMKFLNGEEVEKEILIPTALYRQADALQDSELK